MSRVLIIADTHAPCMLEGYVDFLQSIQDQWQTDRVVHIGDLVDWASISYHPKAPSLKNSSAEFMKASLQVAELYDAFPEVDWLIGNHDALTERHATDLSMPVEVLKEYTDLWDLDGWTAYSRFDAIEIDGVLYQHGDRGRGGNFPALMNARDEFQSVVQGHFHAAAGVQWGANRNRRFFGMQVGCGVDHRLEAMSYGKKYTKKPILGCGVVIDGIPYFEPMELTNRMGVLK